MAHQSQKVIKGYSTVFRQWRAESTHCKFLHGYAISFTVTYEGHLDERNWTVDFGAMKRSENKIESLPPKQYLDHMFDHTTIIAQDDPALLYFEELNRQQVIQLRILPNVGAEKFAEFVYEKLSDWILRETKGRCKVISVQCHENENNSGIFVA